MPDFRSGSSAAAFQMQRDGGERSGTPESLELSTTGAAVQHDNVNDAESLKASGISERELTRPLLRRARPLHEPNVQSEEKPGYPDRLASWVENTFRVLGLQVVLTMCKWAVQSRERQPKRVAVFYDRPAAVLASLLHVVPIGGCVVLIVLIKNGYYIGGELSGAVGQDQVKFMGLQLAAKLHEITMIASLAEMVFSSVRREFVSGRPIPFASLAAGFQFDSIAYLWSRDFFSICNAAFSQSHRTLSIVALVVVCSILGVTVAPASATAMKPVLDYWPAGGTAIWVNGTIDSLYPATLDGSQVPGSNCETADTDDQCPSTGWQTLGTNMLSFLPQLQSSPDALAIRYPDKLQVAARSAILEIYIDIRQPPLDRYTFNYTVSTAAHAAMAEALAQNARLWDLAAWNSTLHGESRFYYRQDARYSMSANNALVHVRCHDNGRAGLTDDVVPAFPNFGSETYEPAPVSNSTWIDWIKVHSSLGEPNLLWVDLPSDVVQRTSLGAIATVPSDSPGENAQVWACSVDARWANTEITSDGIRRLTYGQPWSYHINGNPLFSWLGLDYFPRIQVHPTFAQYLNPRVANLNSTVFAQLCMDSGLWGSRYPRVIEQAPAIEATLNLMVVNGLVRVAPNVTVQGEIADWDGGHGPWWRNFMPASNQTFGWGGNAYNVSDEAAAKFLEAYMRVTAKGYAYSSTGGVIRASLAILGVYVGIAAVHISVTILTGMTSSSWDSPCEIIALAAKSTPPHGSLDNTGAGISQLYILKQTVCIEAKGSELQLSFRNDRLPPEQRMRPNHAYG